MMSRGNDIAVPDKVEAGAIGNSSFRSIKSREYADTYMMDIAGGDRRQARMDRVEQRVVQQLIGALPRGAVVVDVPCGNGRMTQLAGRLNFQVVALDFNHAMLEAMALRGDAQHLRRRGCADITSLPLPDKSVDLFINMRLLHHIRDDAMRVRMYGEIARVTRGKCVTSFWSTHCWRHLRKRLLGKKVRGYPISPSQLRDVCRRAGLAVLQFVPTRAWVEEECLAVCEPR